MPYSTPLSANASAPMANSTGPRSEEHTSELQSQSNLVCRLLLEKKKQASLGSSSSQTNEQGLKTGKTSSKKIELALVSKQITLLNQIFLSIRVVRSLTTS